MTSYSFISIQRHPQVYQFDSQMTKSYHVIISYLNLNSIMFISHLKFVVFPFSNCFWSDVYHIKQKILWKQRHFTFKSVCQGAKFMSSY